MKRIEIASLALATAVVAGPADAQNWSGNWFGVTLAYGAGTYGLGVSALNQAGPAVDVEGFVIGLRYTRHLQYEKTVLGFDTEISTGPDGLRAIDTEGTDWACFTGECNVLIERLVTLRGRYGILVNPSTLAYGAMGVAVGRVTGGIMNSDQQGSSTAVGYTVGVGLERMLSENVSLFGEADLVDLGTLTFGTDGFSKAFDAKGDFATVLLGVNFRF